MRYPWHSLSAAALLLAAQATVGGSITDSTHDFRNKGWSGGRICIACHTPQESDTGVYAAPLWSQGSTTERYAMYGNPALDVMRPDGNSKLCLSCHDGAIGTDRSGVGTGATLIPAVRSNDNTLMNHHPIGFIYDAGRKTPQGSLFDPSAKAVTIGSGEQSKTGTITTVLLFDGKIECQSCHDVHNTFTVGTQRLVRASTDGRTICLACHDM